MELKFGSVASSLTLIATWAYSLGWIKSLYYYSTVGVGLDQLELTPQDYLFASWYTVENVMFFLLLLWIAAISQRPWPWIFVLAYLPIPFLTDWIYGHLDNPICRYLVENPHSILKFFPFTLLILLIAVAWSISAAKHIGSSDAKRVLNNPEAYLMHVHLRFPDNAVELKPIESQPMLYMFSFSAKHCIVLDLADNIVKQQHIRVLDIPRDSVRLVDGTFEIPGAGELINK